MKGGRAPKARVCYICGRPTLLPGFENHVIQCKALFEKREAQKPVKERRPCPTDPMIAYRGGGGGGGGYSSTEDYLYEANRASQKAWEATLSVCEHCGRSFLPDKLSIHQRSCTAQNPARRVDASLHRTQKSYDESSTLSGSRMAMGSGGRGSGFSGSNGNGGMAATGSGRLQMSGSGWGDFDYPPTNSGGYGNSSGNRQTGLPGQSQRLPRGSYGGGSAGIDPMTDFPTYGHLLKCSHCGRNFNEVSYTKHVKVCQKVFHQKRKVFDSSKARTKGTELAAYLNHTTTTSSSRGKGLNRTTGRSSHSMTATTTTTTTTTSSLLQGSRSSEKKTTTTNSSGSKWKAQSLDFRRAIRLAKQVSLAEKKSKVTGIPLHTILDQDVTYNRYMEKANTMSSAESLGYIQCPTCGRSFNQKAAERHIPKVRDETISLSLSL